MMIRKYVQVGLVALCVLSSQLWGQQPQRRGRGMPESARQEVEKMRKAGATHQKIREFLEKSRKNMRSQKRSGQPGKEKPGGNKSPRQFTIPHALDPALVKEGYNLVVDKNGNEVLPQGRPFQEGYKLTKTTVTVKSHNKRAYAKVFAIMAPMRDALIFNVKTTTRDEWLKMTAILEKNKIKTKQWLGGPTPRDNYYSSKGIFGYLKNNGPDYHPMMKYLEEAELELKSRVFSKDFDFTNPQGVNPYPDPGQGLIE
ncbi:MAG: hypothetical protein QF745_04210 [Planctomycetota bacterium]|nr:hypothetical protein [Planctomycetota bacterium]